MSIEKTPELSRNEYTEFIYSENCFGNPIKDPEKEDITAGINRAVSLENRPVFLEGLSERLTELGISCSADDKALMLSEVKNRYKKLLGKSCPRTVQEWIKGTVPGVTSRQNHYDLCYCLEMNFHETAVFFQKYFLSLPFNVKNKIDAVYMYALYHKKPYSTITYLLEQAEGFVSNENSHTSTSQIIADIFEIADEEKFLHYLSSHCYGKKQQFQLARKIIDNEINVLRKTLLHYESDRILSPDRMNSLTIEALLGYKYQSEIKKSKITNLPKRFTESLPNDVTLGKIMNGAETSYELLRKTLILLKFYNFYCEADNDDENSICGNLLDFYDELNGTLISCGFAQLYVCHPFDCLVLYCANSYDPIDTLYCIMQK